MGFRVWDSDEGTFYEVLLSFHLDYWHARFVILMQWVRMERVRGEEVINAVAQALAQMDLGESDQEW